MNWWLLTPAIPAYLGVGLAVARWSFVDDLGDSPRLEVDPCEERFCVHDITMVNGQRHRPTKKYKDARSTARFLTVGWPLLMLLCVVVAPFGLMAGAFDRVINRPTKAEKLTQRQRDLAALSTRAKELGLPVPAEWSQKEDHLGPRARSRVEELAQEYDLAKQRNPKHYEVMEEFEIRNKYGKPIWIDEPS